MAKNSGWSTEGDSDWETSVFVYGTLKKGEPNHHILSEPLCGRSQLISGTARTFREFPLVIAGPYNIPYCLNRPGTGHRLRGELYSVDRVMFDSLDVLEGYPHHYIRSEEDIVVFDYGEKECTIKAWIYLLDKFTDDYLTKPHLQTYSARGTHGLEYVAREDRT